jgi:protease-4
MLVIDSPGGTVDGTEVFANIVKNTKKPVLAFVDGLMASAAAWIGTGADEIWASTDTDEIGSIGVLMSFADIQPYYERMGVKFHMVTASTSEDKVKMFEDLRAGKYKEYQENVLDVLDEKFMKVVKENRPKVTKEHLSGKVFFAKDLVGTMIDQIGTFEDAVARLYSISKTSLTSNVAEEEEEEDNSLIINSKKVKMEKLTLLMAAMGVTSIELDEDGYASLSQESLEAIEAGLKAASDAQAKLDADLRTAQADLQAATDASGEENQELANLKDANKQLREENDSLKRAAAGGSAAAITDDDKGYDKKEKSEDGIVTSETNDFMTNLQALREEKASMGL